MGGGIIPAYAGSTVTASRPPARSGDHPRVCGEHGDSKYDKSLGEGSSPRMRGALSIGRLRFLAFRIIPAYAGSTDIAVSETSPGKDIPAYAGSTLRAVQ